MKVHKRSISIITLVTARASARPKPNRQCHEFGRLPVEGASTTRKTGKHTCVFLLVCIAALVGPPAGASPAPDRQVLGCLDGGGVIDGSTLFRATAYATAIFANIGVELHWVQPWKCSDQGIGIQVFPKAPASAGRTALARALPFAPGRHRIAVFSDRVLGVAGSKDHVAALLGHVLAHEIGHIVMGTDAHEDWGLMAANWTRTEVALMPVYPLGFSKVHVTMIFNRLDRDRLTASVQ